MKTGFFEKNPKNTSISGTFVSKKIIRLLSPSLEPVDA